MGNFDPNELKTISISIPMWMYNWLDKDEAGKQINRSQLFRDAVEFKMKPRIEKVSPVMFLISVFGICFSVTLILIGVIPTPIHIYARAFLTLLGGGMAVSTSLVYYKEKQRIAMQK